MKQKIIKTDKATVLVVELPNGKYVRCHKGYIVQSCSTELDLLNKCKRIDNGDTNGFIHIGNWQLLGRLPDITEEQASKVVEEYKYNTGEVDGYFRYENDGQTDCPIESLESLLYVNKVYNTFDINRIHLFIKVD